jgi:hypothetical protein
MKNKPTDHDILNLVLGIVYEHFPIQGPEIGILGMKKHHLAILLSTFRLLINVMKILLACQLIELTDLVGR